MRPISSGVMIPTAAPSDSPTVPVLKPEKTQALTVSYCTFILWFHPALRLLSWTELCSPKLNVLPPGPSVVRFGLRAFNEAMKEKRGHGVGP